MDQAFLLFKETECLIDDGDKANIDNVDEDKMRCHILDCLVALYKVQKKKKISR
jgi:hypothetical protein